jgi:hypothetical protein
MPRRKVGALRFHKKLPSEAGAQINESEPLIEIAVYNEYIYGAFGSRNLLHVSTRSKFLRK